MNSFPEYFEQHPHIFHVIDTDEASVHQYAVESHGYMKLDDPSSRFDARGGSGDRGPRVNLDRGPRVNLFTFIDHDGIVSIVRDPENPYELEIAGTIDGNMDVDESGKMSSAVFHEELKEVFSYFASDEFLQSPEVGAADSLYSKIPV